MEALKMEPQAIVLETLEQYHQHPALGCSGVKEILRSPKHFHHRYILGNRRDETEALRFGTIAHAAIVEPKRFLESYVIEPKFVGKTKDGRDSERSAAAKEMRAEWEASLEADAILVTQDDADAIVGMIESVQGHPDACAALKNGIPERSYYATLRSPSGRELRMKTRPDYVRDDGPLVDLKSTINAGFDAFRSQIRKMDWDTQAAIGTDIVEALTGKREDFIWIAVEKEPPYCCAVYVANDVPIEIGRKFYRRAMDTYIQCLDEDRWPFQQQAQNMDSPYWAMWDEGAL